MVRQAYKLVFAQNLIKEPVMYVAARDHNLLLNVRRARITEEAGEATIELEGEELDIQRAIKQIKSQGVIIEDAIGEEGL